MSSLQVAFRDAEVAADLDVVREFIGRARQIADLQDGHLAQARVEAALVANILPDPLQPPRRTRAVNEGAEEIDVAREQVLVFGC